MVNRTAKAMLAVAIGVAGVAVAATPASAVNSCRTLYACLWSATSARGGQWNNLASNVPNFVGRTFSNGVSLNDHTVSVENADSEVGFTLYEAKNYGGVGFYLLGGQYFANLAPDNFANKASSLQWD